MGGLAIVNGTVKNVHYTDALSGQYGAVGAGEYVVILEKNDSTQKCYIEYNTSSARKRGYTNTDNYIFKNMQNVGTIPSVGQDFCQAETTDISVYAGPSDQYDRVGGISQYEPVTRIRANVQGYSFIQFTGLGNTKRGYVLPGDLEPYEVVIPDFTYPNVTKDVYAYSGQNRPLEYYQIGTGNKHLILNFAIHGFEDQYDHDGDFILAVNVTITYF
ncbi:MAG TPA: hypothetical protein VN370_10855 [Desulfitobacteriaceae bacterium]|nr:hypothetical protein [Desulfitobacteriaceae bacterium]